MKNMEKVILVGNKCDFTEIMKAILVRFDRVKCIFFLDTVEAQKYLKKSKDVDFLITNYEMPQMNGFELAKKVLKKTPKVHIIVYGNDVKELQEIRGQYKLEKKVAVSEKNKLGYLKNLI